MVLLFSIVMALYQCQNYDFTQYFEKGCILVACKWWVFMQCLQCFLSHLLVAGCDIGVRFSVRPSVNIYVDVRHTLHETSP